jgi:ubiquinone/menaquinone biosynthesis C-methylase UbiE
MLRVSQVIWSSSAAAYGRFTLPGARGTHGVVTALDIEPQMVARVRQKAEEQALPTVRAEIRDFVSQGTGLKNGTQSHIAGGASDSSR